MANGDGDGGNGSGGGFSLSPRTIGAVAVGALALVFVLQNTDSKRVDVLLWDFNLPQWLWMVVLFVAGVVVGSLYPWLRRKRD